MALALEGRRTSLCPLGPRLQCQVPRSLRSALCRWRATGPPGPAVSQITVCRSRPSPAFLANAGKAQSSVSSSWCGAEEVAALCSGGDTGITFLVRFAPCHRVWQSVLSRRFGSGKDSLSSRTIRGIGRGHRWRGAERSPSSLLPSGHAGNWCQRLAGSMMSPSLTRFFCVARFLQTSLFMQQRHECE